MEFGFSLSKTGSHQRFLNRKLWLIQLNVLTGLLQLLHGKSYGVWGEQGCKQDGVLKAL